MTANLLRVGSRIINLDNVLSIDLGSVSDDVPDIQPEVIIEFAVRGSDEIEDGFNRAAPYTDVIKGEEAVAIRRHLIKACPDVLGE